MVIALLFTLAVGTPPGLPASLAPLETAASNLDQLQRLAAVLKLGLTRATGAGSAQRSCDGTFTLLVHTASSAADGINVDFRLGDEWVGSRVLIAGGAKLPGPPFVVQRAYTLARFPTYIKLVDPTFQPFVFSNVTLASRGRSTLVSGLKRTLHGNSIVLPVPQSCAPNNSAAAAVARAAPWNGTASVHNSKQCIMSPWSGWTPCSVSCGCGLHYRTRVLLQHGDRCHDDAWMQRRSCYAGLCDREHNASVADLSASACAAGFLGSMQSVRRYQPPANARCSCDPEVDTSADVTCALETHHCHYRWHHPIRQQRALGNEDRAPECDGIKNHTSIRVHHVRASKRQHHYHHKCKMIFPQPAFAGTASHSRCRCCDCLPAVEDNGCPCGAATKLFGHEWRGGSNGSVFVLRPKPNTTTCEVVGEVLPLAAHESHRMFVRGFLRQATPTAALGFRGVWSRRHDPSCPLGNATVSASLGEAQQHSCGELEFDLHDVDVQQPTLRGNFHYADYPSFKYNVHWRDCGSTCDALGVPPQSPVARLPAGAECSHYHSVHSVLPRPMPPLPPSRAGGHDGVSLANFQVLMLNKVMDQVKDRVLADLTSYFDKLDVNSDGKLDRADAMPFEGHFHMGWLNSLGHAARHEQFCAFHHNKILDTVLALGLHGNGVDRSETVPDSPIAACLASSQVQDAKVASTSTQNRKSAAERGASVHSSTTSEMTR
jgi:hypothetical protein